MESEFLIFIIIKADNINSSEVQVVIFVICFLSELLMIILQPALESEFLICIIAVNFRW